MGKTETSQGNYWFFNKDPLPIVAQAIATFGGNDSLYVSIGDFRATEQYSINVQNSLFFLPAKNNVDASANDHEFLYDPNKSNDADAIHASSNIQLGNVEWQRCTHRRDQ